MSDYACIYVNQMYISTHFFVYLFCEKKKFRGKNEWEKGELKQRKVNFMIKTMKRVYINFFLDIHQQENNMLLNQNSM